MAHQNHQKLTTRIPRSTLTSTRSLRKNSRVHRHEIPSRRRKFYLNNQQTAPKFKPKTFQSKQHKVSLAYAHFAGGPPSIVCSNTVPSANTIFSAATITNMTRHVSFVRLCHSWLAPRCTMASPARRVFSSPPSSLQTTSPEITMA